KNKRISQVVWIGGLLSIYRRIKISGGCPLLAQSRYELLHRTCPLLGVKRTSFIAAHMSAYDPKRTQNTQTTAPRPESALQKSHERPHSATLQGLEFHFPTGTPPGARAPIPHACALGAAAIAGPGGVRPERPIR